MPDASAAALRERLAQATIADEARLSGRLQGLLAQQRRAGADGARLPAWAVLARDVEAAVQRCDARAAAVPEITYPDLPVSARREELLAALRSSQAVVVAGETGSGKTTQLPKMLLETGRGVRGTIAHTQPRRIAARTVAARVAEELGVTLGQQVGYAVRFDDRSSRDSLLRVMTDGLLLAELASDRMLRRYDTVVLDEAHERSLSVDFLLGVLVDLMPRRPDLQVVVTSATIDTARFAAHLGGAPVVEVSGRTYPVEVRYRPRTAQRGLDGGEDLGAGAAPGAWDGAAAADADGDDADDQDVEETDLVDAVVDAVAEVATLGPGDVLVFLPGERDIRDAADALAEADLAAVDEVVPLYGRLSAAEQGRVFASHRGRRVVLSTNVAETSLTVPGVRYVVDSGLARVSRFDRRRGVQRLPVEAVSRASADQRAGRCGRLGPGVCVRLYAPEDYEARPAHTDPEVLRTDLAAVLLQMASLGLGEVEAFPFLDPPDRRDVRAGLDLLHELSALEPGARPGQGPRLTPLGRRLARLPLDPRLARVVLAGAQAGVLDPVLVVVAALTVQDPRERPADARADADRLHARFRDPASDFATRWNLWRHVHERRAALSSSQWRRELKAEHLHVVRVREWQDLVRQLRDVCGQLDLPGARRGRGRGEGGRGRGGGEAGRGETGRAAAGAAGHAGEAGDTGDTGDGGVDWAAVHRALLTGHLSRLGHRLPDEQGRESREFAGARGARFAVQPGSALARRPPRWVMAAELVETTRLWARTCARVDPAEIEAVAGHLLVRSWAQPRWDATRGAAVATESATLYGLPVVSGRKVPLAPRDAPAARELFLREGLAAGAFRGGHPFLVHLAARRAAVADLSDRLRRADLLADDEVLVEWLDARVPEGVADVRSFARWWKTSSRDGTTPLAVPDDVLLRADARAAPADFPDAWDAGAAVLPLTYRYAPGEEDDGVTAHVPLPVLHRLSAGPLAWHVPGMRAELLEVLLRGLPKELRRSLIPLAGTVDLLVARVSPRDGPLPVVLSGALRRLRGLDVAPDAFAVGTLPAHLRLRLSVHDVPPAGAGAAAWQDAPVLAAGRDLGALRVQLDSRLRATLAALAAPARRTGATTWTFGTLPEAYEAEVAGLRVAVPLTLADEGRSVGVVPVLGAAEVRAGLLAGTRRLVRLATGDPRRAARRLVGQADALALALGPGGVDAVLADCAAAALDALLAARGPAPVRDEAAFAALLADVRARLPAETARVAALVARALRARGQLEEALGAAQASGRVPARALADVRTHADALVAPGFVAATGARRLPDLPRWLSAAAVRVDRLRADVARDARAARELAEARSAWDRARAVAPPGSPAEGAVAAARWQLEELRVALFAPSVPTPAPVSVERVLRTLEPALG